jgi:PPM family protein phosphatase
VTEAREAPESERTGALSGAGVVAAARSDRGPRERNEDTFVCRPDLGLFAVIDGMGGQKAGERAAGLAREALLDERDLLRAFLNANERIHKASRKDAKVKGMGCVASAARVGGEKALVAHVGDTRVYLAGEAGCEQLTCDHTVAARAQEEFGISAKGARDIGGHNQVTRDLGGQPRNGEAWIDSFEVKLQAGDLLVLCSDGVHGPLQGELFNRIREARKLTTPPEQLADDLVEMALAAGGGDNTTAVVVRLVDAVDKPRWWNRDVLEWMRSRG